MMYIYNIFILLNTSRIDIIGIKNNSKEFFFSQKSIVYNINSQIESGQI